jgi:hypothetical protein
MPTTPTHRASDPCSSLNRRSLLIGSAAFAPVVLTPALGNAAEQQHSADDAEGREPRYRETEHIRTFYALSRF